MIWPVAILAGGLAKRLRPLTDSIPKAMIEIHGRPFISHQLELLASGGFNQVVILVGHLGEMIQDFVGDGRRFGIKVCYSFDGPRLLGTGGAVRRALHLLGPTFFTLYGDSYLPTDYQAVGRILATNEALALMTVFRNDGQWDTSNVEMDCGTIVAYNKVDRTSRMNYIDYGLGVFHATAFAKWPADRPFDLVEVYQDLLATGRLAAYEIRERFFEIGSPEGLADLNQYLARDPRP